MKIQLFDGYFIEPDPLNLALKQSYTGRDKDGKEKEAEKTIGYWGRGNLPGLIRRFSSLIEVPEGDNRMFPCRSMQTGLNKAIKSLRTG